EVDPAEPLAPTRAAVLMEGARLASAPRWEPAAVELRSAEPEPGEAQERHERAAVAEHDRGAERDPAGRREVGFEERVLPGACDRDREPLADLPRRLGHGPVVGVPVDRRGRRVDPERRRCGGVGDRRAERPRRLDARAQDLGASTCVVARVDAPPGEGEDDIRAVDEVAHGTGITPPRIAARAPDRRDLVAIRTQPVGEDAPAELGRPGDHPSRHAGTGPITAATYDLVAVTPP